MAKALALARRAEGLTRPNPPVGAVAVKDGVQIGQGWHKQAGGPHAEVFALRQAGDSAQGSTLYVTLEPCPMCAGAMVMACLGECFFGASDERQGCCESVYAITQDPAFFWRVRCVGGLLAEESRALLRGFFIPKRSSGQRR